MAHEFHFRIGKLEEFMYGNGSRRKISNWPAHKLATSKPDEFTQKAHPAKRKAGFFKFEDETLM